MQAAWSTSKCVALSALMRSSVVFGLANCGLKERLLHASSTMPKNWYLVPTQRNANCHARAGMGWREPTTEIIHTVHPHPCYWRRTCPSKLTSSQIRHTSRCQLGTPSVSSSAPTRLMSLVSLPVLTCRGKGGGGRSATAMASIRQAVVRLWSGVVVAHTSGGVGVKRRGGATTRA